MRNEADGWTRLDLIILGAVSFFVLGLWILTVAVESWRGELQAAGDSVAAIAALLAGFAAVLALVTLRHQRRGGEEHMNAVERQIATMEDQVKLQREALKEQFESAERKFESIRKTQESQEESLRIQKEALEAQRRALHEDLRQQRLARIQDAYAQFFAAAADSNMWLSTADALFPTGPARGETVDKLNAANQRMMQALFQCRFYDHDQIRINSVGSMSNALVSGTGALVSTERRRVEPLIGRLVEVGAEVAVSLRSEAQIADKT